MNPKLLFASCALFLTSCIHGNDEQSITLSDTATDITISEARSFYENEILSRADTECKCPDMLSPGDYTPQWDNAKMSQNNRIACVDVPIIPTYRYRAIRSEFRRGQAQAYIVNVSQKVVIVKDRESGAMASYIMSLIPDKDFAAKHKGDISDLFLNANDRGKYSGAIFYTRHGLPVNYVHYTDGSEDCNISTLGDIDGAAKAENLRNIMKKFVGIKFNKTSNILSRGESYENYDDSPIDEPDGGGGPEGEMTESKYIATGRTGFNKIHTDFKNRFLKAKTLQFKNGEYVLNEVGLNSADIDVILDRYRGVMSGYENDNAKDFGVDVHTFWRNGLYSNYWLRDNVITVIIYCDENFSGNFIDTALALLDETTVIVKDEINIERVKGMSKFTVGLTIWK